jgi:hypothetical protein
MRNLKKKKIIREATTERFGTNYLEELDQPNIQILDIISNKLE